MKIFVLLSGVLAGVAASDPLKHATDTTNEISLQLARAREVMADIRVPNLSPLEQLKTEFAELEALLKDKEENKKRQIIPGVGGTGGSACITAGNNLISSLQPTGGIGSKCDKETMNQLLNAFSSDKNSLETTAKNICDNACGVELRAAVVPVINECISVLGPVLTTTLPFLKILKVIPIMIDMFCSKNKKGDFCIAEFADMATTIEKVDFKASSIASAQLQTALETVCTDCFKQLLGFLGTIINNVLPGVSGIGSKGGPNFSDILGLVCAQDVDKDFCLVEFAEFFETMSLSDSTSFKSEQFKLSTEQIDKVDDLVCQSVCLRKGIEALLGSAASSLAAQFSQQTVCVTKSGQTCLKTVMTATSNNIDKLTTDCDGFDSSSACDADNQCIKSVQSYMTELDCCGAAASYIINNIYSGTCNSLVTLPTADDLCPVRRVPVLIRISFSNKNVDLSKIPSDILIKALEADALISFSVSGENVVIRVVENTVSVSMNVPASLAPAGGINFPGNARPGGFSLVASDALFAAACVDPKGMDGCYSSATVEFNDPRAPSSAPLLARISFTAFAAITVAVIMLVW